jgi:hypothetical protein
MEPHGFILRCVSVASIPRAPPGKSFQRDGILRRVFYAVQKDHGGATVAVGSFWGGFLMSVLIPVSWGELIDKFTILEIKVERIQDPIKVANVKRELTALLPLRDKALQELSELLRYQADLKAVNETLWEVEDELRAWERRKEFGPRFIELARAVYHENDRRASLKHQINQLLESGLVEEKSYQSY